MVPLAISNDEFRTGIQLRLRPVVGAGKKPELNAKPVPEANPAAAADTFEMHISVEVEQSFVQARLDKALDLEYAMGHERRPDSWRRVHVKANSRLCKAARG